MGLELCLQGLKICNFLWFSSTSTWKQEEGQSFEKAHMYKYMMNIYTYVYIHLKNPVWAFSVILWKVFVGHPILAASGPIENQGKEQALE